MPRARCLEVGNHDYRPGIAYDLIVLAPTVPIWAVWHSNETSHGASQQCLMFFLAAGLPLGRKGGGSAHLAKVIPMRPRAGPEQKRHWFVSNQAI